MIAEHRKKRNLSFHATLGCLAAAEIGMGLDHTLIASPWEGILGMIAALVALEAIATFLWGCRHYALAKGYSEKWLFLSLFTALTLPFAIYCGTSSLADSLPGYWHCLSLLGFGAGVFPLYLLPDRSLRH